MKENKKNQREKENRYSKNTKKHKRQSNSRYQRNKAAVSSTSLIKFSSLKVMDKKIAIQFLITLPTSKDKRSLLKQSLDLHQLKETKEPGFLGKKRSLANKKQQKLSSL